MSNYNINIKSDAISTSIISNSSNDDGDNTNILTKKGRRGKKKIQKNKNSKTDKSTLNAEKHSNIQSNEENSFGLNKRKKNSNRNLADTSTNTADSFVNDKLYSSILIQPQDKTIKKKMNKKPKIQNNTEKRHYFQIKGSLEFLLNSHDHGKKAYKASKNRKYKQKKKKKSNSKMVMQENTELSNEVTKHKHSKISEYLEKDAFKNHLKESYNDTTMINPNYNSRIFKDYAQNPLILKKSLKRKKKKKKKKFKDVIQKEVIPPKKNIEELQQSITTSKKKLTDNNIATDYKNNNGNIFKQYFEFLCAHTDNVKDPAMFTPYSSKTGDDNVLLPNESLKKKEKHKNTKPMTSEIMMLKKLNKSKRQATLVNDYLDDDVSQILSMDKKMYNSENYVCEDNGKNFKFAYDRDDNKTRAEIDNDKDADTIKNPYFSKSLKDNNDNTLLSNTLVEKLKKQKRKHETEATRVEIAPLKKKDAMEQNQLITKCENYSENEIAEIPLHTSTKSVHHINDYEPVVGEKSFKLFSVQVDHQKKDQTVGNDDEGTSCMISDTNITNIKSSIAQQPLCAQESFQTGKSTIKCDICSKTFISKYKLSIHYRTHTGEKPYKCDFCSRCFTQQSSLVTHYRTHTGEKPYECDVCDWCFSKRSTLVTHYRIHTGEKPYKCDLCDWCFAQRSNLVTHYRRHTGEKPYKCDVCDRCFMHQSYLIKHHRTHTGEKPYNCDLCDWCFAQRSNLVTHYRRHTGEKPYKCDFCDRCFSKRSILVKHRRTHTGENPYGKHFDEITYTASDIIGGSYTQPTNLQNVYGTGEEPYSCKVCGRLFIDSNTLIAHASEGVYECSLCKKSFLTCTDHTKHMQLIHRKSC